MLFVSYFDSMCIGSRRCRFHCRYRLYREICARRYLNDGHTNVDKFIIAMAVIRSLDSTGPNDPYFCLMPLFF